MAKKISVLESQIAEFIANNPDLDCVNLSLLQGVQENNLLMIKTAIAAGANIYIEIIEGDSDLMDLIANYLKDPDIKNFLMDIVLKDAIQANDRDDELFALNNGANRNLLDIRDSLQEDDDHINSVLMGDNSEPIIGVHKLEL